MTASRTRALISCPAVASTSGRAYPPLWREEVLAPMTVRAFDSTFSSQIPPMGTPARPATYHRSCPWVQRANPGNKHESDQFGGCVHRDLSWHRVSDRVRFWSHPRKSWDVVAICGRRLGLSADPAGEKYVVSGLVLDVPGSDGGRVCSVCERKWAER